MNNHVDCHTIRSSLLCIPLCQPKMACALLSEVDFHSIANNAVFSPVYFNFKGVLSFDLRVGGA